MNRPSLLDTGVLLCSITFIACPAAGNVVSSNGLSQKVESYESVSGASIGSASASGLNHAEASFNDLWIIGTCTGNMSVGRASASSGDAAANSNWYRLGGIADGQVIAGEATSSQGSAYALRNKAALCGEPSSKFSLRVGVAKANAVGALAEASSNHITVSGIQRLTYPNSTYTISYNAIYCGVATSSSGQAVAADNIIDFTGNATSVYAGRAVTTSGTAILRGNRIIMRDGTVDHLYGGGGVELNGGRVFDVHGGTLSDTAVTIQGGTEVVVNGSKVQVYQREWGRITAGGNAQVHVEGDARLIINNVAWTSGDYNFSKFSGTLSGGTNVSGSRILTLNNVTSSSFNPSLNQWDIIEAGQGTLAYLNSLGGAHTIVFNDVATLHLRSSLAAPFVVDLSNAEDFRFTLESSLESAVTFVRYGEAVTPTRTTSGSRLIFTGIYDPSVAPRGAASLTWTAASGTWAVGVPGGTWETDTTCNYYFDGDHVIFRGGSIGLEAVMTPGSVLVSGEADTQFSGEGWIAGSGTLRKEGEGTLTLGTANRYTGGSSLSGGRVVLGTARSLGTGDVTVQGTVLDLGGFAVTNNLTLDGAVTLLGGEAYAGKLRMTGGSLSGNALNLAQDARLSAGTVNNVLTGTGGLVKEGAGEATLAGVNTYTGLTEVQAGSLILSGKVAGDISVAQGAALTATALELTGTQRLTLGEGVVLTGSVGTAGSASLAAAGGVTVSGTLTLNGGSLSFDASLAVGRLVLGSGDTVLTLADIGQYTNGSYTIISAEAVEGNASHLSLTEPTSGDSRKAYSLAAGRSGLTLTVTDGTATLTWKGGSGTWTPGGGGWDSSAANKHYYQGDHVIFAGGSPILDTELLPGSISVSGSSDTAFYGAGSLGGSAALTKTGSGTLRIDTANSYKGGTTLSAGSLVVGNVSALGTGDVSLAGGTLNLASLALRNNITVTGTATLLGSSIYAGKLTMAGGTLSGDTVLLAQTAAMSAGTVNNVLTGSAGLVKSGGGTLSLHAANSYTGGTQVTDGTLKLGNAAALGTGKVTATGGTLDFNSLSVKNNLTVSGPVTLLNGGSYTGKLTMTGGSLEGDTIRLAQTAELLTGTVRNNLTGIYGITKTGTGELILAGTNSYIGDTEVRAGTLTLTGSVTGSIVLWHGVCLRATNLVLGKYQGLKLSSNTVEGSVTTLGGSTLSVYGSSQITDTLTLNGGTVSWFGVYSNGLKAGTLVTGTTTTRLSLDGLATCPMGDYQILSAESSKVTLSRIELEIPTAAKGRRFYQLSANNQGIMLSVTGESASLNFAPSDNAFNGITWAVGEAGGVWYTSAQDKHFYHGDDVVFNGNGSVSIESEVRPASITARFSSQLSLSGSGSIAGSTSLTKSGAGMLTLNTANSFTGGVYLTEGGIVVGHAEALGAGDVTLTGGTLDLDALEVGNALCVNGTVSLRHGSAYTGKLTMTGGTISGDTIRLVQTADLSAGTIRNKLIGTAGIVKKGAGTLTLTGFNQYAGGTELLEGTLTAGAATAFGTGDVVMHGGTLNLGGKAVGNTVLIDADAAEIRGGSAFAGQLVMGGGTLSGTALKLSRDAQLSGGTIGNALTGTAGVVKTGQGELRLNGANSYTGLTDVQAGRLVIGGSLAGDIRVAQGAKLSTTNLVLGGSQTLTLGAGVRVDGSVQTSGNAALVAGDDAGIGGTLTLNGGSLRLTGSFSVGTLSTGSSTTTLELADIAQYGLGSYTLINAESMAVDVSKLTLATPGSSTERRAYELAADGTALTLLVTNGTATLVWNAGAGTWAEGEAGATWDSPYANKHYYQGDHVVFEGGNVTLRSVVSPGSIEVRGSAATTISGSGAIAGSASLLKGGSGTLTLNTSNNFSGGTTIEGGTVAVGAASALGTGAVRLQGGTLNLGAKAVGNNIEVAGDAVIRGGQAYTGRLTVSSGSLSGDSLRLGQQATVHSGSIANALTGPGGLTKTGSGTLTLSGTNTYTGLTDVREGCLTITGSLAGDIHVAGIAKIWANELKLTGTQVLSLDDNTRIACSVSTSGQACVKAEPYCEIYGTLTFGGGSWVLDDYLYAEALATGAAKTEIVLANPWRFDEGEYFLIGGRTDGLDISKLTLRCEGAGESRREYALSVNPYGLMLNVKGATAILEWSGGTGTWAVGGESSQWITSATDKHYYQGDSVIFRGGEVQLGGELTPADVSVLGSADTSFTGSGSLAGSTALTKLGSGTLRIDTANSYRGGTMLMAGRLVVGQPGALGTGEVTLAGGTLDLAGQAVANDINVLGNARIDGGSAYAGSLNVTMGELSGSSLQLVQDATLSGGSISAPLSGSAGLLKLGPGTATLSGPNSYSGLTRVQSGTLVLLGSVAGDICVEGKATLAVATPLVLGDQSFTLKKDAMVEGDIATTAGSRLDIDAGARLSGTLTLNGGLLALSGKGLKLTTLATGAVSTFVSVPDLASYKKGSHKLITYRKGMLLTNLRLDAPGENGERSRWALTTGATAVTLVVDDSTPTLTWNDATGSWGLGLPDAVWTTRAADKAFYNGDMVVFGSQAQVEIVGEVAPSALTVQGKGDVRFDGEGSITGATALVMKGKGTLTLATDNSYTGGTTISNGTVRMAGAQALGQGGVTLRGGTLDLGGQSVAQPISVTGKATLAGAGGYTAALAVNKGTLTLLSDVAGDIALAKGTKLERKADSRDKQTTTLSLAPGALLTLGTSAQLQGSLVLTTGQALVAEGKNRISENLSLEGGTLTLRQPGLKVKDIGIAAPTSLKVSNILQLKKGSHKLITYTAKGISPELGKLVLDTSALVDSRLEGSTLGLARNAIVLNIAESCARLSWNSDVHGIWSLRSGSDWTAKGVADTHFYQGDHVTLSKGELTLVGSLAPGSITAKPGKGKSVTLNGPGRIVGAASLSMTGKGTLILNGDNAYEGGTAISAGLVSLGHAEALGRGGVSLKGGTLDLSGLAVGNDITVSKSSTLDGASNYAGALAVTGGTLKGGAVTIDGGALLSGGTITNELTGTGGLTKQGKGTATLAGTNRYSGLTDVQAGTLVLKDGLTGGIHVAQGATLSLSNSGKLLSLCKGQSLTLDAGAKVKGSVVTTAGSFLSTGAKSSISGTLTLGGGTLVFTQAGLSVGTLSSTGSTTLDVSALAAAGSYTLISYKKQTADSQDLTLLFPEETDYSYTLDWGKKALTLLISGSEGAVAQTQSVSDDMETLLAHLATHDAPRYATAMSSQIEGNLAHLRLLRQRIGSGQPLQGGAGRLAAYMGVQYADSQLDNDASGPGYKRHEWAGLVGVEYSVSEATLIGLAATEGHATLSPGTGGRAEEIRTSVNLYALHRSGAWEFRTLAGVGLHRHEFDATGGSSGKTRLQGRSANALADVAYTIALGDDITLQPFATLASSFNAISSFQVPGSGLCGDGQHAWATDISLGLRYRQAFSLMSRAPRALFSAHVGTSASVGDTDSTLYLHHAGSPRYGFNAAERNRWSLSIGAGLDIPLNERTSLYGSLDANLRGDSGSLDAQLGVQVAF